MEFFQVHHVEHDSEYEYGLVDIDEPDVDSIQETHADIYYFDDVIKRVGMDDSFYEELAKRGMFYTSAGNSIPCTKPRCYYKQQARGMCKVHLALTSGMTCIHVDCFNVVQYDYRERQLCKKHLREESNSRA